MHKGSGLGGAGDGADGNAGAAPVDSVGDDAFARFSLAVVNETSDAHREESTTPDAPEQVHALRWLKWNEAVVQRWYNGVLRW